MKRPNGAGTVRKLGGKRRKPWAAVITTGWDPETGKRLQKYVGYYETYQEAELALAVYRSEPLPKDDLTLEMVYAEWKAIKFRSLSKATQDSYAAAWKYLSQLQHLKIKDISSPTFLPFARSRLAQGGEKMVCKRDRSAILADYFRKRCYFPTLEQIDVRNLSPHCIRHTFATQPAEAGASTAVIQRLMGHKKILCGGDLHAHRRQHPESGSGGHLKFVRHVKNAG